LETILTARLASITVLTEFDKENRLENRILDELDTRERAQANEYIQGILRRRSFLDFLIAEYSSVPIAEMEATFRNILRLGLYGLLFMDGTPDHAAINEPVEIAKRKISSRSGDMVNAILRRAQREREANQLPKPAMPDRVKLIATTFSHPEWLVERYVKRFGEREAFQLFQANNKRPDFYLRVNNLRTKTENFTLRLD